MRNTAGNPSAMFLRLFTSVHVIVHVQSKVFRPGGRPEARYVDLVRQDRKLASAREEDDSAVATAEREKPEDSKIFKLFKSP